MENKKKKLKDNALRNSNISLTGIPKLRNIGEALPQEMMVENFIDLAWPMRMKIFPFLDTGCESIRVSRKKEK